MPMTPQKKMTPDQKMSPGQKMTQGQKRRARLKRKRESMNAEGDTPITYAAAKRLLCRSEEEEAAEEQDMMEKDDDEELSDKIKLDALAKKTEELQGYVNQLQDAVTIGMFQLRDLKIQIAAATAALSKPDE
ncbi:hypothetical protein F4801DRAFT_584595 [Xylaria longipes]|nr:hypothetical protein F4801DRAFT_584595 [Xylaria longipes]